MYIDNCYFVSKNETRTREAIRKSRIVKVNLDKFNDKKSQKKVSGSPKNALKYPKIKCENVSIVSPSVKKLRSPKLSRKIKIKSNCKNDKIWLLLCHSHIKLRLRLRLS